MMDSNATEKTAYEIGFELIGTKDINEDKYFVVKKKKKT